MQNQLLKKLGEETLYSAKGHFKACDLRRQATTWTIWTCAILNVFGLLVDHPMANKAFAAIGLIGLVALLIWNEGEGKQYQTRHRGSAEKYLALHKEIRTCYFTEECDVETVKTLSEKVRNLDGSDRPDIPSVSRWLAKRAIEKKGETDNWFLND